MPPRELLTAKKCDISFGRRSVRVIVSKSFFTRHPEILVGRDAETALVHLLVTNSSVLICETSAIKQYKV